MTDSMSTNGEQASGLTMEKLREAIDLVYPPLYYGLDKNIERGKLYLCKETDFNPEFIVIHPDDLEDAKHRINSRRLVNIKDEPPAASWDRMSKRIQKIHIPQYGEYYCGINVA